MIQCDKLCCRCLSSVKNKNAQFKIHVSKFLLISINIFSLFGQESSTNETPNPADFSSRNVFFLSQQLVFHTDS